MCIDGDASLLADHRFHWQGREIEDILECLADRHPEDYPWGVQLYDDTAGQSQSVFYWFASPDELLVYLAEAEPVLNLPVADARIARIKGDIEAFRFKHLLTDVMPEPLIPEINEALAPAGRIVWWGHFTDLCQGATPAATSILRAYRCGNPDPAPIAPDEVESFITFVYDGN